MVKQYLRWALLIALIVTGMFAAELTLTLHRSHSFAPIPVGSVVENKSDIFSDSLISVFLAGDSWVGGKKLDSILENYLDSSGYKSKVFSRGLPNKNTKEIFLSLFQSQMQGGLQDTNMRKPDYCVIIAGVNDAVQHFGPEFYAHHIFCMAKYLLINNIRPLIMVLPQIDSDNAYTDKDFTFRSRAWLQKKLFEKKGDNWEHDPLEFYRISLREKLKEENMADKVILFDFRYVTGEFHPYLLFKDPTHLNQEGNKQLARYIGIKIRTDRKRSEAQLQTRPDPEP